VNAYSRSLGSQLQTIKSGDATPLLVMGSEKLADYPDTPTMLDEAPDADAKSLLEFHARVLESGRTIAGPPNMNASRLKELRAAFAKVVQDPGFDKTAAAAGRPVTFKDGAEVATEVDGLMKAPAEYVSILKEAYQGS
jgi:tripartite-type tricarboxylate transporter receptor subunit TctC